jgi:hypothetical protein
VSTVQIPPEGVPAEFAFEVPAPDGMSTLGGIRLHCTFSQGRPEDFFSLYLDLNGERCSLVRSGEGATTLTYVSQFHEAVAAPLHAAVTVNQWSHLDPGNTVTLYAWGAQTESGLGALNPDEGGEPSSMTATIDVGTVEVLEWADWNRLTGANQGEQAGGS